MTVGNWLPRLAALIRGESFRAVDYHTSRDHLLNGTLPLPQKELQAAKRNQEYASATHLTLLQQLSLSYDVSLFLYTYRSPLSPYLHTLYANFTPTVVFSELGNNTQESVWCSAFAAIAPADNERAYHAALVLRFAAARLRDRRR